MKMRKTATVRNPLDGAKIPLRTIFMVFMIFMFAVIARFIQRTVEIVRAGPDVDLVELETAEMIAEEEARQS
jgi:C4-dicarboxylate transporter DctQ subunit